MYTSIKRGSATLLSTIVCCLVISPTAIAASSSGNKANKSYKPDSEYGYRHRRPTSVLRVRGIAITGSNRYFGNPIWDLGEDLGSFGFNFIFAHNPGQASPLDITASTPDSAIIASGLDLNYLALFGLVESDIDPNIVNVPIHEAPVLAGPAGQLAQLPSVSDVGATVRSRIASNKPVTLKKWLGAKGTAEFKCFIDNTSTVKIRMKSMIPDSMYSAWGVFSFDSDGNGQGDQIGGVPLGGVPNVMMTDDRGRATLSRKLNFCPKNEPRLKYVTIAYHADTNNNGSVPDQALLGQPGGTLAHAAVSFPINVVGCAQPANNCP